MTQVIEAKNLTKRYKNTTALNNVTLQFEAGKIYGLLGRNGAGKTTLMSILTAQNFATSGQVRVLGQDPYENDAILSQMCFVREGQKYPDDATPAHAFKIARLFFANWDQTFAEQLISDFELPMKTKVKSLSRGQLSAVGVIIGLASRAPITFFDEPYLGLDAVARHTFYDHLVRDYAAHPRTIVLSSHLIDEIAHLIEHVVLIDHGEIVLNTDAESVRSLASTLTGPSAAVAAMTDGYEVLGRKELGNVAAVTIAGQLDARTRSFAESRGIEVSPVSLQEYVVLKTLQSGRRRQETATDTPTNFGGESA